MNCRSVLLILFTLRFFTAFGQIKSDKKDSLILYPHWLENEKHSLKISSSTEDIRGAKTNKATSIFDAHFSVSKTDDSGFIVEWYYTNCKLDPNEYNFENTVLKCLLNKKIVCRISSSGKVVDLLNIDELKESTNLFIDSLLIVSSKDQVNHLQLKVFKQLFSTNEGVKLNLLKNIKVYTSSFGISYQKDSIKPSKVYLPNVIGKQLWEGIQYTVLNAVDNAAGVFKIEKKASINSEDLRTSMLGYIKENPSLIDTIAFKNKLQKNELEYSIVSSEEIDFKKGIVLASSVTRKMYFGFDKRTIILTINNTD